MKQRYTSKIAMVGMFLAILIMCLCACTEDEFDPSTENTSPASDVSITPQLLPPSQSDVPDAPTPSFGVEPSTSMSTPKTMTETELSRLVEVFNYPFDNPELISFLTCTYNTPSEISLNEVFYNGAGGCTTPTYEQKDYLAENGYDIPTDWRDSFYPDGTFWDVEGAVFISPSTIDDILQRRVGIDLSKIQEEFGLIDSSKRPWEWVDKYDVYFARRTDTNLGEVQFISGQHIGDDICVADYYTNGGGNLGTGTYRVTFKMTDENPNTIVFISNVPVS